MPAPDESRKSRAGLVAGIGLAAAALVGAALFVTKDRWLPARPPAPEPPSKATTETPPPPPPASVAAPPPALEGPKIIDPKAVEAEARRIGAEREKAARDAAAKQQAAAKPAASAAAPPLLTLQPAKSPEAPKEVAVKAPEPLPVAAPPVATAPPKQEPAVAAPAVAAPAAPVPTEVSVPEKPPVIPASASGPAKEGELVGPGDGVEEPKLVRLGSTAGMPPQARLVQRAADGSIGTPVLIALVDEKGAVLETRVIRPSNYKFVDEAAARALKGATIQPATKDGVKVKMWKTFPIAVRP